MTEELVTCEIRIDEATGQDDSDSRITGFKVIMPLKLQSTYGSPTVRCVAWSRLVIHENK